MLSLLFAGASVASATAGEFRAPAYPLVTVDPYTSCWSTSDNLYGDVTRHWTGAQYPLIGVVKVDGTDYRFMGKEMPLLSSLVPTAVANGWNAVYTTSEPSGDWYATDYKPQGWKSGEGAFGSVPQEALARTMWDTPSIWVRRNVDITRPIDGKAVYLNYSHDDDVIIYVNGIKVVDTGNQCHKEVRLQLPENVVSTLKPGKDNVIAAWCHDRGGLAFLDFGLEIEENPSRYLLNEATQLSAQVLPMNTVYKFRCGAVDLDLTFTAPMFMDDLDLLSRPVNYITYNVAANDGKTHDVQLYFEAGREWAIDNIVQETTSAVEKKDGLVLVSVANKQQKPLNKAGDNVRIDWGTFYFAAPAAKNCTPFIADGREARKAFAEGKKIKQQKGREAGFTVNLGSTSSDSGYLMIGYNDGKSIQYFGNDLNPYWNRKGDSNIYKQFALAAKEYSKLMAASSTFDKQLMADADEVGGPEYAQLCALAYRQAISAHKLVESPQGDLLWLSKENFSNGSIGTVDVTYPSTPLFLYYNPELAKGLLNHIFYYSESGKWTKPFPAHDVGTYPLANGQTYGGDMPVEEAGNMLITAAAITRIEGNADYAKKHWDVMTTWTDYLSQYGLDPENQLCTDDFAGHFAHNANLSIKAILGIASYAYMADMLGKKDVAAKYYARARELANEWEKMANDDDHYRLTFDKHGTWSQKYNIVWDKLLGFNVFPEKIVETELPYYLTHQNKYGLPLDNRETYTKTDWIMWTATLAPNKPMFRQFIIPVYNFMNDTRHRVPMSDWVYTDKPDQRGFQARSVVGGYFIKMLDNKLNGKK